MIQTGVLVKFGDPAAIKELERLTQLIGEPYARLLSDPEHLIEALLRESVPPPPNSNWSPRDALASLGTTDADDDDLDDGKAVRFLPPINLHQYISVSHRLIDDLRRSVVAKLQTGDLEAFGLRHGDHTPTLIPRGHWFTMALDWDTATGTTANGSVINDISIREGPGATPADLVHDDYSDANASTAPFVEEFFRLVEQKKVRSFSVSRNVERQLRTWGKSRNPPLLIPKMGSIAAAIKRDPRFMGKK